MHTSSSAKRTCSDSRSASEKTATVRMPSSLQARITRRAISPRFAIRTFRNMSALPPGQPGVEGHVGGGLDSGCPQRELGGIGGVLHGPLLGDQAAPVQVHQALVEGLHSILGAALRDE